MDYSDTIRLSWDKQNATGTLALMLNMAVLKKHAVPTILNAYKQDIGVITYPIHNSNAFEQLKSEIVLYQELLKDHKLTSESKFHHSNILYLLIDFNSLQNQVESKKELQRKVYNRVYLLKRLMKLKSYDSYDIQIKGKLDEFNYQFHSDPILKSDVLNYLIGRATKDVKAYDSQLYKHLVNDATEDVLEQAISRVENQSKSLAAALARTIVKYLNSETAVLRNTSAYDELSTTNAQGDFIYDLFTLFKVYNFRQHPRNGVVKHHDAIRKLIRRSASL